MANLYIMIHLYDYCQTIPFNFGLIIAMNRQTSLLNENTLLRFFDFWYVCDIWSV